MVPARGVERDGLCSTTFGIDFSITLLVGMSQAHEAAMSRPSWVPDESRSVAVADAFVDGEIEARSSDTIDWKSKSGGKAASIPMLSTDLFTPKPLNPKHGESLCPKQSSLKFSSSAVEQAVS